MAPSWHLGRLLLGESGNRVVEPPVYRRRRQRLWMHRGGEAVVALGVSSNGMSGRKREGTDEIPGGRRRLRRRKRAYKAQAEVACDAAGKSEEAVLARKAWTAKPAGAKGLYSSQAFEERGTA